MSTTWRMLRQTESCPNMFFMTKKPGCVTRAQRTLTIRVRLCGDKAGHVANSCPNSGERSKLASDFSMKHKQASMSCHFSSAYTYSRSNFLYHEIDIRFQTRESITGRLVGIVLESASISPQRVIVFWGVWMRATSN